MKKLILVLFIPLLLSCNTGNKSISNNETHVSDTQLYFVNKFDDLFISIGVEDSLVTIHEYHIKSNQIIKCKFKLADQKGIKCQYYAFDKLVQDSFIDYNRILLSNILKTKFQSIDSGLNHYLIPYYSIDSTLFWKHVSVFLDSITFKYPQAKFLFDMSILNQKGIVNHKIDKRELSKNITIDELGLPKLFFEVVINQSGQIVTVNYDSWGTEIYKDLIDEIKVILLKKSIKPYEILGYPINVKLDIGVIIR